MNLKLKKYILLFIGMISLCLGIVGILLPILPTTPFLLLSAFCFAKSSQRLHNWLIHHKILGKFIYNYITYHAIPKSTKIFSILFLWVTLIASILIVQRTWITLLLIFIGCAVSLHLLLLKTLEFKRKEEIKKAK